MHETYTVYREDSDGNISEQVTVRAQCHRQHVYTHTTLVGVSKAGARKLAAFCKSSSDRPRVGVPGGPLLNGWETA